MINVYKDRVAEHGINDPREYRAIRKLVKRFLLKNVQSISFETYEHNQSQRITSKNVSQLIFNLAEQKAKEDGEELGILKQAAEILRKRTLLHKKNHSVIFNGCSKANDSNVPDILSFFYQWLLAGNRKLGDKIDTQVAILANTMSQHTLFNVKTNRQATYNLTEGDIRSRHTYTPIHQICLGLSLRHSDRNNVVLGMLSAPNYGYSITPRQCLKWETTIANAVIKNIQLNNDVYIPPGMARDAIPMFHLEDTPDGKNTAHYLILSIFQRKQNCSGNYSPELDQHRTSLKLLENSFGVLLPHDKSVKGMSKRTEGASDFNVRNVNTKEETIQHWLIIRSLENLLRDNSASFTHYQQEEHKPYSHTAECNIRGHES